MQFAPVIAGTAPAAALTARGPDHDVEVPNASNFNIALGNALLARPATLPGSSAIPYSGVAGVTAGFFYTRDTTLLTRSITEHIPGPPKLQANFDCFSVLASLPPLSDELAVRALLGLSVSDALRVETEAVTGE